MNDSSSVAALLASARRRMQWVAFVRLAALIVPAAVAAASLAIWLVRPAAPSLVTALAAAAAAALIGAAAAAVSRASSSRQAAAALDERLRLEDRLVTVMTYLADPDPVARLVLRETASRIATVRVARVFPLEAPAQAWWVIFAAAGAVALAATQSDAAGALGFWGANRPSSGIVIGGGRSIAPPANAQTAIDQTRESNNAQASPSNDQDTPRGTGAALVHPQTDHPAVSTAAASQTTSASSSPSNSGQNPTGADTPPNESKEPASGGRSTPTSPGDGRTPSHAAGAAGQRERVSAKTGGASDGPAGQAQGASAGAARQAVSAGGISGGTLTARPPDDRSLAPLDRSTYAARYADGWSRAQLAIASAQVPSSLREYVKRYFASIHPDQIK